jgi:hypothetical protein
MKTYEQWSSRAKQQGWAEDQYSQAAYQGYVNDFNKPKPKQSSPAPAPSPQPPQQQQQVSQQNEQLQSSITQLQQQIQQQADDAASARAAFDLQNTRVNASGALNSTILTSPTGSNPEDKKKKPGFLTPFGG